MYAGFPSAAMGTGEGEDGRRIKLNVQVKDGNGQIIKGVMVRAQFMGKTDKEPASLTDKEGRCGLKIREGEWILKVIRLPKGVLLRKVVNIDAPEGINSLDITLVVGQENNVKIPDSNNSAGQIVAVDQSDLTEKRQEISAKSLDQTSAKAAVDLVDFTETVLAQASTISSLDSSLIAVENSEVMALAPYITVDTPPPFAT